MIAALDVHYSSEACSVAAVEFSDYGDAEPMIEFTKIISIAAPYIAGEFYRRELPCILSLIEQMGHLPGEVIVDAYVMLGDKPGLGWHLFEHFEGKVPVIGVAKSKFAGAPAFEVFRGASSQALYVTAAGIDPNKAAQRIQSMHGIHRIPTLLKRVDKLARDRVNHNT